MPKGVVQSIIDQQKWIDQVSDAVQPIVRDAFGNAGESGRQVKDLLNGVWLGHPLHPVLTDVPIGAWTMTQLLDLLSAARGDDPSLDLASDITLAAGLAAAVPTIITGLTDWSDTDDEHRRLGTAHALINVASVTLYLGSLGLRASGSAKARGLARFLSAGAYLAAATSAYVAGDLVYTLGQAINRDAFIFGPKKFTKVTAEADLQPDKMTKFDVRGQPVVLLKHDDGIHAFNGTCAHAGCYLWQGELNGHIVTCKCHGSQFDISTGKVVHGPATAPIATYEVQQSEGQIQVKLREE